MGHNELYLKEFESTRANRKCNFFIYYEIDECIECNNEVVITGAAAKILFKILNDFKHENRTRFTNREFKREKWIFPDYSFANFEVRLDRLVKATQCKCSFLKINREKRGVFCIEVQTKITVEKK